MKKSLTIVIEEVHDDGDEGEGEVEDEDAEVDGLVVEVTEPHGLE